ncbi:PLS3 [Cordylochernes scorpioides]|uniref:PLS3 n=1 Tax=Cordylochernes scorpioides TaxID=51811 RepID=A0ABY6LX69_9ARAC|nr:PLS3 [Cordylochernes scorpioides]
MSLPLCHQERPVTKPISRNEIAIKEDRWDTAAHNRIALPILVLARVVIERSLSTEPLWTNAVIEFPAADLDKDGNGYLDIKELKDALETVGIRIPQWQVRQMTDSSGTLGEKNQLTFEEFQKLYTDLKSKDVALSFKTMVSKRENLQTIGGMSAASSEGTTHSVRQEEQVAFSDWINSNLRNDPDLKHLLPIDNEGKGLYEKVKDGVLLCKIINHSCPETIDERAVNKERLTLYTMHENLTLALNSAQAIGCNIINIDAHDLSKGKPHLVLGLLWQIIRNFDDDSETENYSLNESSDVSTDEECDSILTTVQMSSSNCFIGKNGYRWNKNHAIIGRTRSHNIITHLPGLKGPAKPKPNCGIDIFNLFFTAAIIKQISEFTNAKIEEFRQRFSDLTKSTYSNFTSEIEIRAFLGLLYLAGVYKSGHENVESLFASDGTGRDIFRSVMSVKRFLFLLLCIRFDNFKTRCKEDRLSPIRDIFQTIIEKFQSCYTPAEYLTVDEMLVGFRGKCPFKIYIPSKPNKYGIKIVILADSRTHYMYNAMVYTGKSKTPKSKELSLPTQIVLDISRPLWKSNRNITADNWFTSIELVDKLKEHGLTYLGTMRKNKPQIPPQFQPHPKRESGTSIFGFSGTKTLVSYVPKKRKSVILISSMHHDNKCDETTGKPDIIMDYNLTKGGVDTIDQMVSNFSTSRRSRRWPLALFYALLDITALNSYIIFNYQIDKKDQKERSTFIVDLGRSLIDEHLATRNLNSLPLELQTTIKKFKNNDGSSTSRGSTMPQESDTPKRCYKCPSKNAGKVKTLCSIGLFNQITLENCPGLVRLLRPGEQMQDLQKLSPEQILIRWVNYQLERAGVNRQLTNFTNDIKDSVIYTHLLRQIAPIEMDVTTDALYERDNLKRAEIMLQQADKLGCRSFVTPPDVHEGVYKLNLAFVANLFNKHPALDHPDEPIEMINLEETPEEKTYRNWMNSMGVRPYVNWIYSDFSDGLVAFQLYDIIKAGMVKWSRVTREFSDRKGFIEKLENCNYVVELGRQFGFSLVGIAGEDIYKGNPTLTLALIWQLMRAYTLTILTKLANSGHPLAEKEIVEWANEKYNLSIAQLHSKQSWYSGVNPGGALNIRNRQHQTTLTRFRTGHLKPLKIENNNKIYPTCPKCSLAPAAPEHILACIRCTKQDLWERPLLIIKQLEEHELMEFLKTAGKESHIRSFADPLIQTSRPIIDLIDAISPGSIDYSQLLPGDNNDELMDNAKYAVSMARKIGARIYALPEDIIAKKQKMVMTIFACLMTVDCLPTNGTSAD